MFIRSCGGLLKNQRYLVLRRQCSDKKIKDGSQSCPSIVSRRPPNKSIEFLAKVLGIKLSASREIFLEHTKLLTTKLKDIESSVNMLKSLNYDRHDLIIQPVLLYTSALSIENRYMALKECGCVDISIDTLSKFIKIMNREIKILKLHGIIPNETNVAQTLVSSIKEIQLPTPSLPNDEIVLKTVREHILNLYLREKLQITQNQLVKLWTTYNRFRNKSFRSIIDMIDILTNVLKFTNDRIINNGFVLYGDPNNVRRIIAEIKTIGNEDIREILYRRPKIMMSNCDGLKISIKHITTYGIAETSINKCLDILTLSPDTILERLRDLDSIEEFQVLKTNPRVLRLVYYQTKARVRLEYLNELKVKCASLHILSSHASAFIRYTKGDEMRKGCDTVTYLANIFKMPVKEMREIFSRHIYWCHLPTVNIKQTYEFLRSKLFDNEDIFHNIQILLYPIKRINNKLVYLQNNDTYSSLNLPNTYYSTITNRQMLALCLYLIEMEFHFTGDGIWTDQDLHPVENFSSIIPDFPESWKKGYKYGTSRHSSKQIPNRTEITGTL